MLVEPRYCWIAKENTAAAIGLQAVFVRVDDDGIGFGEAIECATSFFSEIFRESEVAAISSIGVETEAELFAEGKNFR